jgi:putative transposase
MGLSHRADVTGFKERYNHHWRLEKMGFMVHLPLEARQTYAMRQAAGVEKPYPENARR